MEVSEQTFKHFTSLAALKTEERELLKKYRESNEPYSDTLLDEIERFIGRVQATGAMLDKESEQEAAQDLLGYWVTRLYRAGRRIDSATLADFDPKLSPPLADSLCPYVGLDAFSEASSKYFFGRDALVRKMTSRLKRRNLLVIEGSSGSGKSSLVLAGLLPALKSGALGGDWHFCPRMVPGSSPLVSLARALMQPEDNAGDWISRQVAGFLEDSNHLAKLALDLGRPVVLVIDQFEEVFTLTSDLEARAAFEKNLVGLIQVKSPRNLLILTMRSDYDSSVALLPTLKPLFDNAVEVPTPPSRSDLCEAILKPAKQVGLMFEEGVVDSLVDDLVAERAALPLLQFTLLKLWEKRSHSWVTRDAYKKLGGGREALATCANDFYEHRAEQERTIVKRILLRLVRPGTGPIEFVANRIRRQELYQLAAPAIIDPQLDALIKERLVRLTRGATQEDAEVEIAHEALIRNWGKLVGWLEEDRGRLTLARLLEGRAADWERKGRGKSGLLDEFDLREAENWITNPDAAYLGNIDKIETFVNASKAAIESEKKEKERAERRLRWTRNAAIVFAVIAIVLALVVFGRLIRVGADKKKISELEQARFAEAVADDSIAGLSLEPEYSALLATLTVKAVSDERAAELLSQNAAGETEILVPKAEDDLHRILQALRIEQVLKDYRHPVLDVAFSPDGLTLATAGEDGLELWDALQGSKILWSDGTNITTVAFSPDGSLLATGGDDGTLSVWDYDAHRVKFRVKSAHQGPIAAIAFGPDGRNLVTAGDDGMKLWNLRTRTGLTEVTSFKGTPDPVSCVAFSPDGSKLLTGGSDYVPKLWDSSTGKALDVSFEAEAAPSLEALRHTDAVLSVAFSEDGKQVATASKDQTIILWDAETGKAQRTLRGHTSDVTSVAFSPDGTQLVSASKDATVRIWDASSGLQLASLVGHSGPISQVRFSPDGTRLATASDDLSARIWDVQSRDLRTFKAHGDAINDLALSQDGKKMITGSQDATARVWDTASGKRLLTLQHPDGVFGVAFSPDGRRVATGCFDKLVRLWDARDGRFLANLEGHTGRVTGVAFSPDGLNVAAASRDKTVIVWDLASRQILWRTPQLQTDMGVVAVAFSPNGGLLAVATGENVVRLYNAAKGNLVKTLEGHTAPVYGVDFSPDGKLLATTSVDKTAKVWEVSSWKVLYTLTGHTDVVMRASFAPDSQKLVTASFDGLVKVWDLNSGRLLVTLANSHDRVYGAVFSADGKQLVTAGWDQMLRFYALDRDELVLLALARTNDASAALSCSKHLKESFCSEMSKAMGLIVHGNQLAKVGKLDDAVAEYQIAQAQFPIFALKPRDLANRVKQMSDEEAGRWKFDGFYAKGRNLAPVDPGVAVKCFQLAAQSDPSSGLDPRAEVTRLADERKKALDEAAKDKLLREAINKVLGGPVSEGKYLLLLNLIPEGVNAYKKALGRNPGLDIPAGDWNILCWKGSLGGFEAEPIVMEACEKAVALSSGSANYRDSRAVNEALRSKFTDAVEDFQAFVNDTKDPEKRAQRLDFIKKLGSGQNPITPEVKKQLLNGDTVPPSS